MIDGKVAVAVVGGGGMGGGHGTGGNAGPSPVGGGMEILLLLGAAYAGRRVYKYKKTEDSENEK